jgi:hypothetical protein
VNNRGQRADFPAVNALGRAAIQHESLRLEMEPVATLPESRVAFAETLMSFGSAAHAARGCGDFLGHGLFAGWLVICFEAA